MHPKSYIETTDRRDFGGKPSKWRWGRVLSWKLPEFCSVGGARSKKTAFLRFTVPFDCPAYTAYRKQFFPKPLVPMESRDSKGVLLLAWRVCEQAFGRYRPYRVQKSGHATITKVENLHTITHRKIHWSQKCYYFRFTMEITKLSRKNRFRTVASPGACERLAVLNWIQYILLVIIITTDCAVSQYCYNGDRKCKIWLI